MVLRIVGVFHGEKCEGLGDLPAEVGINPPMTMAGMIKMQDVIARIKTDPRLTGRRCDGIYSSRLARALDAASAFALEFNLDIVTLKGLGQMANKDGDKLISYPGHEDDSFAIWREDAIGAVDEIWNNVVGTDIGLYVIAVGHRPTIGGMVTYARGVPDDEESLARFVRDPALVANGYVVLDIDDESITEVPLPDLPKLE